MRLSSDLGSFLALSSNRSVCKVHVRSFTSVAVQITSLSPCVGSFTRILTRHPFTAVNSVFSWDSGVLLSNNSILEINFWYYNVDSLNVEFIREYNRYRVSFSDASGSAYGAFVEAASGPVCFFACLFVCFSCFFIRIGPLRKKNRVLLVENLRSFVSPWRPFQGDCPAPASFGIQTPKMLSLLFSTAAGNWICRYLSIRCLGL